VSSYVCPADDVSAHDPYRVSVLIVIHLTHSRSRSVTGPASMISTRGNARLGKGDLWLENGEVLRKAVAAGEEQEELGGRGELPGEACG
jgi:hypothetical protein